MAISTFKEAADLEVVDAELAAKRHDASEEEAGAHTEKVATDDEGVSNDAQAGVRKVEAATIIWSKWHLIAAYGMSVSSHILATVLFYFGQPHVLTRDSLLPASGSSTSSPRPRRSSSGC
jgi:hypothetical protein